ncbi:hypothetical protein ADK66_21295 [Micromonospora sp. NRRL B-16802]|nr:hypothetical protein ADK66_21295 [Micromonospora sp. NRRL B-16802]
MAHDAATCCLDGLEGPFNVCVEAKAVSSDFVECGEGRQQVLVSCSLAHTGKVAFDGSGLKQREWVLCVAVYAVYGLEVAT